MFCISYIFKLSRDLIDLRLHELALVLVVADLEVQTHFEGDTIRKDEKGKFFIKKVT